MKHFFHYYHVQYAQETKKLRLFNTVFEKEYNDVVNDIDVPNQGKFQVDNIVFDTRNKKCRKVAYRCKMRYSHGYDNSNIYDGCNMQKCLCGGDEDMYVLRRL